VGLIPQLCKVLGISTDTLLTGKNDEVKLVPAEQRKSLDQLTLRVKVNSAAGDKVRVNLPMTMVKLCMEIGVDMLPNVSEETSKMFGNVDMNKIVKMVEQGMIGKLVEVESAGGDTVEIVVE
jgi:hypothetical protein